MPAIRRSRTSSPASSKDFDPGLVDQALIPSKMWTIVSAPTVISIRAKAGRFTQIVVGIAGGSCFRFGPPPSLIGGVIVLPVIFNERIADSFLRPPDASIFFLRISSAEGESAGF